MHWYPHWVQPGGQYDFGAIAVMNFRMQQLRLLANGAHCGKKSEKCQLMTAISSVATVVLLH